MILSSNVRASPHCLALLSYTPIEAPAMANNHQDELHPAKVQQAVAADTGIFEKSVLDSPADQTQSPAQTKTQDDDAPMDGGTRAWLQVVASFLLYFNHLYALQPPTNPIYKESWPSKHLLTLQWFGDCSEVCSIASVPSSRTTRQTSSRLFRPRPSHGSAPSRYSASCLLEPS